MEKQFCIPTHCKFFEHIKFCVRISPVKEELALIPKKVESNPIFFHGEPLVQVVYDF